MGLMQEFTTSREPELNFFELGVNYACGRRVGADLIEAHKWFNIAALRGDMEAARRRQELASEMSAIEIASAQRRAREWISLH
jgi:TPR repeat protein